MTINELSSTLGTINNGIGNITPTTAAVIAGSTGLIVGAGAGAGVMALASGKKTKKRKRKSKYKSTRTKKRTRKKKYNYTKRNKRISHKKIHYTKNKQPYIILASGKARFIKKSSSRRSKKLKGGYY